MPVALQTHYHNSPDYETFTSNGKIVYRAKNPRPESITLSELNQSMYDYTAAYSLPGPDLGFSRSFMIKWQHFIDQVVNPAITPGNTYYIPESKLAFKFIHRYDQNTKVWFFTVCTCEMGQPEGNRYPIIEKGPRYDLYNGVITPSEFTGTYDPVYFNDMRYYTSQTIPLDPNTYVNNLVLPWQMEIGAMYAQNFVLTPPSDTVYMVFACSSIYCDITTPDARALIEWPHGLVLYLNQGGIDMLDNDSYVTMFTNHGADYATMCPPNCSEYIKPDSL